MVLVHDQGNVGIRFGSGLNQVFDEMFTRVFASARTGLQNHGRAHFVRSGHDSLNLFQIVDVKRGNAVAIGGGVVEQFAHGNECHSVFPNFFRKLMGILGILTRLPYSTLQILSIFVPPGEPIGSPQVIA